MKDEDTFLKDLIASLCAAESGFKSAMLDEEFLKQMDTLLGEISIPIRQSGNNGNKTNTS